VELDVLPYALAESDGPRTFHVNNQGNAGMSTWHAWHLASYQQQITVECARGDELVAAHRLPPVFNLPLWSDASVALTRSIIIWQRAWTDPHAAIRCHSHAQSPPRTAAPHVVRPAQSEPARRRRENSLPQ
jgi:hypothetical protein